MEKTNSKNSDWEIAYFKFALIAPVIQGTFTDASIAAYCRRVTENPRKSVGNVLRQSIINVLVMTKGMGIIHSMPFAMPKNRYNQMIFTMMKMINSQTITIGKA